MEIKLAGQTNTHRIYDVTIKGREGADYADMVGLAREKVFARWPNVDVLGVDHRENGDVFVNLVTPNNTLEEMNDSIKETDYPAKT